jgi:hypothetical protein
MRPSEKFSSRTLLNRAKEEGQAPDVGPQRFPLPLFTQVPRKRGPSPKVELCEDASVRDTTPSMYPHIPLGPRKSQRKTHHEDSRRLIDNYYH